MTLLEAVSNRHSVRNYYPKPIADSVKSLLSDFILQINETSGLHIQPVFNEPKAFGSPSAHYGKFSGVSNYLALIGEKGPQLDEQLGYFGEKIVLKAQQLGLNSCWVALTYKKVKSAWTVGRKEALRCVIALGYGMTDGVPHRSKPFEAVTWVNGEPPAWFTAGVRCALLAPTTMNRQQFTFILDGDRVRLKRGAGVYTQLDAGIVRCHFEIGAASHPFVWA